VLWQQWLCDRISGGILAHGLRTSSLVEKERKQENKEKIKKKRKRGKIKLSNKWNLVEK
jgi:hypothetical protein